MTSTVARAPLVTEGRYRSARRGQEAGPGSAQKAALRSRDRKRYHRGRMTTPPNVEGEPAPPAPPAAIEDFVPILAENPLLGTFGPSDWHIFAKFLELVSFAPGHVIMREGSEGQDMYFIVEGGASIRRAHIDLGLIGPGDHFGELALISRRMRAASVVALTELVTARLTRERYDALSEQAPAVALRFTQALVSSLGVRLTEMTDSVGLLLRERSLPRHTKVEVRIGGEAKMVRTGTPVRSLLPEEVGGVAVVAGIMNQKAVSLATPITSDATLSPLTTEHWEGKRVFRQSLGLLLLEAARRVDPTAVVRLGPSCGFGQRVDVTSPPSEERLAPATWASRVVETMRDLIQQDIAFRQELWTVEEACSHFIEIGWAEAATLLRASRDPAVPLVGCGDLYAFSPTPMVPTARLLEKFPFRLAPAARGLMLYYGDEEEVGPREGSLASDAAIAEPPCFPMSTSADSTNLAGSPVSAGRKIAFEEEPWLKTLGVTGVGAFNEACVVGSVSQIIRVSEGLHEKRISQIADTIAARSKSIRVICIAGPSSSGKTTFIRRLTVQLQVDGIHPVGISLDNYYVDRAATPLNPLGDYDFESLEAIDLNLFRAHVAKLMNGESVTTAAYDFTLGKSHPEGGPTILLGSSDMLLVEGIHGLNPTLLDAVLDRSQVFRIFIQPSTALPFDRLSRVSVSDVRLLRRIVRDRHQRATDAATNILRWPSVRAGEKEHIFPFLDHADAVFDSALVYEMSVIKVFADRYLLEVPHDHPASVTAHRLRQLIDRFITIYPDHVPPTSILREFIGGSGFEI